MQASGGKAEDGWNLRSRGPDVLAAKNENLKILVLPEGDGKLRGTALRWNERGFGFIKPNDGSEVCAFPVGYVTSSLVACIS